VNQIDRSVLSCLIQSLGGAFAKATGATPAITQADLPSAGGYLWYRVHFDEVPEFRIFAGTVKRSDDDSEAASASMARQLRAFPLSPSS
jgi:hypothetical protein